MARKITAISGLLAETPETPARPAQRPRTAPAARPVPEPTPAPQESAQVDDKDTVRSTLDLPRGRHAELLTYAAVTGAELGWPVRPQHVLRVLVDQLLDRPDLAAAVVDGLRAQGRPIRRKS